MYLVVYHLCLHLHTSEKKNILYPIKFLLQNFVKVYPLIKFCKLKISITYKKINILILRTYFHV